MFRPQFDDAGMLFTNRDMSVSPAILRRWHDVHKPGHENIWNSLVDMLNFWAVWAFSSDRFIEAIGTFSMIDEPHTCLILAL